MAINDKILVEVEDNQEIIISFDDDTKLDASIDNGVFLYGTIKIGETTTAEPGESASVTNSGTDSQPVLDFVIPRGDTLVYKAGTGINISEDQVISAKAAAPSWEDIQNIPASISGNYEDLTNKPSINDVVLTGNKSFEDLNLSSLKNSDIELLFQSF